MASLGPSDYFFLVVLVLISRRHQNAYIFLFFCVDTYEGHSNLSGSVALGQKLAHVLNGNNGSGLGACWGWGNCTKDGLSCYWGLAIGRGRGRGFGISGGLGISGGPCILAILTLLWVLSVLAFLGGFSVFAFRGGVSTLLGSFTILFVTLVVIFISSLSSVLFLVLFREFVCWVDIVLVVLLLLVVPVLLVAVLALVLVVMSNIHFIVDSQDLLLLPRLLFKLLNLSLLLLVRFTRLILGLLGGLLGHLLLLLLLLLLVLLLKIVMMTMSAKLPELGFQVGMGLQFFVDGGLSKSPSRVTADLAFLDLELFVALLDGLLGHLVLLLLLLLLLVLLLWKIVMMTMSAKLPELGFQVGIGLQFLVNGGLSKSPSGVTADLAVLDLELFVALLDFLGSSLLVGLLTVLGRGVFLKIQIELLVDIVKMVVTMSAELPWFNIQFFLFDVLW